MNLNAAPVPVKAFGKQLIFIDVVLIFISSVVVLSFYEWPIIPGMALAFATTTLNAWYGYHSIFKHFGAPMNQFMAAVLGGMAKRMIAMLMILIIVIQVDQIEQNSFVIALFVSYICKSVLEMIYINRKSKNPNIST